MKLFATILIWLMEFEFVIGTSSGMDPHALADLRSDITRWQGYLLRLQINGD